MVLPTIQGSILLLGRSASKHTATDDGYRAKPQCTWNALYLGIVCYSCSRIHSLVGFGKTDCHRCRTISEIQKSYLSVLHPDGILAKL